jgi:hypothetical protein
MRLSDLAHYIPIPPHGQMPNGAGSCNDESPAISQNCRWYCHCEERSDEAISFGQVRRLLRSLRSLAMTDCAAFTDGSGIHSNPHQ